MLRDALNASGSEITCVVVAPANDTLSAHLVLQGGDGRRAVDVEPCAALIAACRLRIPVFIEEPSAITVPDAYREALSDLDLSDLGE